jgi:hypothetical protein
MASAANQGAYGYPGWGPAQGAGSWEQTGNPQAGPWGAQPNGMGPNGWQRPSPWPGTAFNGPMGIALMVLGFVFYWPVGLAVLIYMLGSGRMSCRSRRRRDAYANGNWGNPPNWPAPWAAWKSWACGGAQHTAASSGNHAFDEYRTETLRRLEEEQKEFGAFLERLRFARDKAEFDQFMAERRTRPTPPTNGNEGGEQPAA